MQKNSHTYLIPSEESFSDIPFYLTKGDRIAFTGDLGTGKTTYIRYLLRKYFFDDKMIIRSPSYTYYNTYEPKSMAQVPVYHFDLYRLSHQEEFFLIGGDDIFQKKNTIILIEWPEILGEYFIPTYHIHIALENDQRILTLTSYSSETASSR